MSGRRIPLEGYAKLLVLVSVLELSLSLLERQRKVVREVTRALLARARDLTWDLYKNTLRSKSKYSS